MSGRPRGEGLGIPSPHLGCYTASPGRYTNTGCRVVLVSLYGPSYLTVSCSLFSGFTVDTFYVTLQRLLWEQRQTRTVLTVLVSGDSTDAVPGQGVFALRCATTGAGFCPDIPVVAQRQFTMVQLFMLMVQFSDKVVEVPVVVQRHGPDHRDFTVTG